LVAEMGLKAILESIRTAGEAQVREIEIQAYNQSRVILADARLEAQQIEEQARDTAVAPAYRERARILQRARLEALRLTGNVRESLLDTVLDQTRGRLLGMRSDPTYPESLRRLTQQALAELEESQGEQVQPRLSADPRDQNCLESILDEMGLEPPVNYDIECRGGLIVKSHNSRIVVINTFEARLERATPALRRLLAALFEDERLAIESGLDLEHV
jgi:vacuolar-type H+-ATPase subunit E/Vma4